MKQDIKGGALIPFLPILSIALGFGLFLLLNSYLMAGSILTILGLGGIIVISIVLVNINSEKLRK